MAEKTTFIKIDRNILEWGWYKDVNTKAVFLHLLLTANIKPKKFMNVEIKRGELATSQKSLAEALGISVKCVRTALKHLEEGGEVAVKRHPRFSVISIPRYDYYQANGQSKGTSTGSQRAVNGQQLKNDKKDINIQEERALVSPSLEEVISYGEEAGLTVDAQAFFDYYEGTGWMRGDSPIRNWKAVMRGWEGKPNYAKRNQKRQAELDDATRRWLEQ